MAKPGFKLRESGSKACAFNHYQMPPSAFSSDSQSGALQSRYHDTHFTDQKVPKDSQVQSQTATKSFHPSMDSVPTSPPSAGPGPQAPRAHPQQKSGV